MSNDNHLRNLPVPFFSQRQNDYTLKTYYFDGEEDENGTIHSSSDVKAEISMDCRTCNITSVMMVMKYLGLTGIERKVNDTTFTTPTTPKEFLTKYFNHNYDFVFVNEKPTYGVACLEDWENLRKIGHHVFGAECELYGVGLSQNTSMQKIKEEIAYGYPVCISIGVEKGETNGHVIVIRGFIKYGSTEYIILNDPWGSIADLYSNLHITSSDYYGSYYYGRTDDDYSDGDNVILKLSDFENTLVNKNKFHRVMFIHAPLWNYPDGSDGKSTVNIYNKINYENGGYPITTDDLWHDGVHLKNITDVHSIGPGRLVVARNEKEMNPYGNTSFVLLEHQTRESKKIEKFYSLYMHLEKLDLNLLARNYFLKEELSPYNWLNEMFHYILPYNIIVGNLNDHNDVEGKINSNYSNILVYEVKSEDGLLTVEENKISTYKVGRRCLIKPLPIKNRKVFEDLLDISKYNTSYFNEVMTSETSYSLSQNSKSYRIFANEGKLLAISTVGQSNVLRLDTKGSEITKSVANFEYFKIYKKHFYYYSMKLKKLSDGEVVNFFDKNSFESSDDISALKNIFSSCIKNSMINYAEYLHSIENGTTIKKYSHNELVKIIDTYYYSTVNSIEKNDFKKFKEDYGDVGKTYINSCEKELEKYIKELEQFNEVSQETESTEAKDFLDILKENIKHITINIDEIDVYDATGNDTNSVLLNFSKYLNNLQVSPLLKVNLLENLIIRLIKIPKSEIKNQDYFKFQDKAISNNTNSFITLIKKLLNKIIDTYDTSFFHSCEKTIEVGKNEIIGKAGKFITSLDNTSSKLIQQIHFEVFSNNEFVKMNNSIINNDSDLFCNPENCIKEISKLIPKEIKKDCKYLDDYLLTHDEVVKFYEVDKTNPFLAEISCKHISEWSTNATNENNLKKSFFFKRKYKTIGKDKKKNVIEIDNYYENIHKPFMWFNSSLFGDKQFRKDIAWYYHPLYFIEKLLNK